MRKRIAAGNWKMNLSFEESANLIKLILANIQTKPLEKNKNVIIFTPSIYLITSYLASKNYGLSVGAQNCSQFNNGAYTGELSAKMLHDICIDFCIIGHSERRQYFGDTDELINQKLNRCYENKISPTLCCGEKIENRKANEHFEVVENQLINGLKDISEKNFRNTVIAYEPVWAIGTGETATPQQANEMHKHIRKIIGKLYNDEVANETTILYGGSVNAKNCAELFAMPDIDGGLVGGASLKADDFCKIIESL